jgi:D-alanyl-D-alanine carboxypeptidase (penicillin-binding protein 5/6)
MRIFSMAILIVIFGIIGTFESSAAVTPGIDVKADSAVLMDFTTGQVLYQKNAHTRRAPASTTKILTSIIAIEKGNLGRKIKASHKAARADGSSIYLRAGDILRLKELLYGILLNSGNDAAIAVAENLAGSETEFARWMTVKAKQIGAVDSQFTNCNGLPSREHYSTAYDLAAIARYALRNPIFADLVKTKRKIIERSGNPGQQILINHNKLLWRYQFADGVKTGYTIEAGHCLVSSATKDGRRLVVVVLKSKDMYGDSARLLDYGFTNYQLLTTVNPFQTSMKLNIAGVYPVHVPLALHHPINPSTYAGEPKNGVKKAN